MMAAARPRLWLVRHALPVVAPGTCYGALDVPADPDATRSAALRLAAELPAQAAMRHSTLQRCEQLALELQALRPDLARIPDPRLREMDFGLWEGRAWDTVPRSDIDAWTAEFASHPPGGGEHLAAVLGRVTAALRSELSPEPAHPPGSAGPRDVVWITHAGVIRCVTWLRAHGRSVLPHSEEWPRAAPGWGEWDVVELAELAAAVSV